MLHSVSTYKCIFNFAEAAQLLLGGREPLGTAAAAGHDGKHPAETARGAKPICSTSPAAADWCLALNKVNW